jgi:hypothetical protein
VAGLLYTTMPWRFSRSLVSRHARVLRRADRAAPSSPAIISPEKPSSSALKGRPLVVANGRVV